MSADRSNKSVILVMPNYGNAPYVWGSRVAMQCGMNAVLPYDPDLDLDIDPRKALGDEFPNHLDRIYLCEGLGKEMRSILRSPQDLGFGNYARRIVEEVRIGGLSRRFGERLHGKMSAKSLSGGTAEFEFRDFAFALNCGAPLRVEGLPNHFLFIAKMSALYGYYEEKVSWAGPLAKVWAELEETFDRMFIPSFNALSHLDQSSVTAGDRLVESIPPLAMPSTQGGEILYKNDEALLVAYSGTGGDAPILTDLAIKSGIELNRIFTLTSAPGNPPFQRKSMAIFGSPYVALVLARGGWGTIWQCVANRKPIVVPATLPRDDPEIAHNIKLIEKRGLGFSLELTTEDGWFERERERLDECRSAIDALFDELFGSSTDGEDGLVVVANKLCRSYSAD